MAVYTFINGERKRVFTNRPRVYKNGVQKTIRSGYTFVNGTRHKIFGDWSLVNAELFVNNDSVLLPAGSYWFVLRGAGGAGGNSGAATGTGIAGGLGGAGAKGNLTVQAVTFSQPTTVNIFPGTAGRNGDGGAGGTARQYFGGPGGGAGRPSVVIWETGGQLYEIHADGGAGGGGGGGSVLTGNGRYRYGAGGGGGGEYIKFDSVTSATTFNVITVAGKDGGNAGDYSANGFPGVSGNTADFPYIMSGSGGTGGDGGGERRPGGAGAYGGGASGGGGGSNGKNQHNSYGGPGGGGAGGSYEAGGGQKGNGGAYGGESSATNHFTIPVDVINENIIYGVGANYGQGGKPDNWGANGFILIARFA